MYGSRWDQITFNQDNNIKIRREIKYSISFNIFEKFDESAKY